MEFQLTSDQQKQFDEHGIIEVGQCVLMSVQTYREMLGISSDTEYADSVAKCNAGVDQIEAGRAIPLDRFAAESEQRYGTQD